MAYKEFYIQAGGSFLNSGSDTSNTPKYTSANGNWNATTGVFIPSDSVNPVSAGVVVGDYASIYLDGGLTAARIARVTAVANSPGGSITLSIAVGCGSGVSTATTGRSITVGGAQKIPTSGNAGPIWNLGVSNTNSPGAMRPTVNDIVRINCKNDAIYAVTSNTNMPPTLPVIYQGYTATPGDGGVAIFDGSGNVATNFNLLNVGTGPTLIDFIFRFNGTPNTNVAGVTLGGNNVVRRCVFHDIKGSGVNTGGVNVVFIECEAYNCNLVNNIQEGGFRMGATGSNRLLRCFSHDNLNYGFRLCGGDSIEHCVADSNTGVGTHLWFNNIQTISILHCDCYNNGSYGIKGATSAEGLGAADGHVIIQSCNLIKNGNTGIDMLTGSATTTVIGSIDNCGYGTGTMANGGAGATASLAQLEVNQGTGAATQTYAANAIPYANAPSGDFKIALAAAAASGYGFFYQTAPGYGGSLGMPVIGAVQLPGPPVGAPTAAEYSGGFAT